MIATLTNTSGRILNGLETYTFGVAGPAQLIVTGGNIKDPLPHPWNRNGSVAIGGTKVLSVHPQDHRWNPVAGHGREPRDEVNLLIQKGDITVSYAAETPRRETEEVFANAV